MRSLSKHDGLEDFLSSFDISVEFFVLPEVYLSPYLLFWCMHSEGA